MPYYSPILTPLLPPLSYFNLEYHNILVISWPSRIQPLPTVGVRLISIMDDAMIHAGQAAYVRGLR